MYSIRGMYIWIDGSEPTRKLRSKTKVLWVDDDSDFDPADFPEWSFDGSSTGQAPGDNSDCLLRPVRIIDDPLRGEDCFLVLCEVFDPDGTPHETNTRAKLRAALGRGGDDLDSWIAFEQEYTLFEGARPLGFSSDRRYPAAQGPYYCGVGSDEVYGRPLVEDHLEACLAVGLYLTGTNAEVAPGQWEYQVGGPGGDPLLVSDHLWLSRWLLYRIAEHYGLNATLDQKPIPGDWNGAGLHSNFSTAGTRSDQGGMNAIRSICDAIATRLDEHLSVYGAGYESRLTGHHETCRYDEFRYGVADRTASIRIPLLVANKGYGYLEDRRPGANADPYEVSMVLVEAALQAPEWTKQISQN